VSPSSTPIYHVPEPPRSNLLPALAAGAIIALVAANIYLYVQIDHLRTDVAKGQEAVMTELTNLKDASSVTSASHTRHLETLKQELEAARTQARSQASQAKAEAAAQSNAHADQLARQIQAEEAKVQQQVSSEISEVKQAATTANSKIADVSTDVGGVKSQVSATQAELQKTIAELKSTRGDLGVQSGLIATNASELGALRRLGERNYFEFKLGKTKAPQRVGDITLQLKKTDPKKNKYTVDVMADDKLTEKKDKNINEPVQFYTGKAKQPYEIVVNQVQKDLIVGYLATPKEQATR
jgi:multidrug efflux pump subunit AcrA (membrane-fusion protein)